MTQNTIRALYKKLIACYPRSFKDQLGESMEQTFNDLYKEKQQTKQPWVGFVLWTFLETAMGIWREYLFVIFQGDIMLTMLKTLGSSTLISLLLIFPFMIMEIINRRSFDEDFPFVLFFGLWLNLFAVSLVLFPIVRALRARKQDMTNPVATQKNTPLTNPKSALIISVVLILSVILLSFLASLGWQPLEHLLNNPNPEGPSVFGIQVASQLIILILLSLPIAAGIIASRPIIRKLQTGGSLFAYPIHLIIVVVISLMIVTGVASLIVDQWPCFIGVPVCD